MNKIFRAFIAAFAALSLTFPAGATLAQAINNPAAVVTLNVASFAGASVDAEISACVAALPSTGGVCDARSVPSGGTINAFTITKPAVTILGPCGLFTLTGSITYQAVSAEKWDGCGSTYAGNSGTKFTWAGDAVSPAFMLDGVRDSEFANFTFLSSTTTPLLEGFRSRTRSSFTSSRDYFHDIVMDGTNGGIGVGIRICKGTDCGGTGGDSNNDLGRVIRVLVRNYSSAAISIEHAEAKMWTFDNLGCSSGGFGNYCIVTALGTGGVGGSFNAYNTAGGNDQIADFYIGAPDDAINIIGGNLENSKRLLETATATSSGFPITVMGVRWSANAMNVDNKAVIYSHRGGFNFIGNIIGSPLAGTTPLIWLTPTANSAVATAIGNSISWPSGTTSATSQPFTGASVALAGIWRLSGNRISDGSSSFQFTIPDRVGGDVTQTTVGLVADAGSIGGSLVTFSGTCAAKGKFGGIMAGSFQPSGACASGTFILTTGISTLPNGLSCAAADLTTPTILINQTAYTTTSVTFTVAGTAANSDLITYRCTGF